jgi:bacillopeptidase F (M6 metalloprotease family)
LPLLQTPAVHATAEQYTYDVEGTANQYSADYYKLDNLNGARTLDIKLTAPASVTLIPTSAPSGVSMWYSNRGDMADSRLTHSFDLTSVSQATLNYKVWFDTETTWDYGYVEVSSDDGKHWEVLSTGNSTTDDPHKVAYGPGYNGASDGWIDESVSLNAYAGKQIQVRFEMITDDAVTRPGMAIDDLSIPEIDYADDFENGDGGWQAEGWLLTDNRLPQNGWVQVIEKTGATTTTVQRWMIEGMNHSVEVTPGVSQVIVAVSPYATVTTVPMHYSLSISSH